MVYNNSHSYHENRFDVSFVIYELVIICQINSSKALENIRVETQLLYELRYLSCFNFGRFQNDLNVPITCHFNSNEALKNCNARFSCVTKKLLKVSVKFSCKGFTWCFTSLFYFTFIDPVLPCSKYVMGQLLERTLMKIFTS